MCRYATPYKAHFVCFSCRKAFKKPAIDEFFALSGRDEVFRKLGFRWKRSDNEQAKLEQRFGTTAAELHAEYLDTVSVCPECSGRMANMGLDFKAPPRTDREAWRVAEAMHENGFIFSSCGCSGPGYTPPAKLGGMPEFLEQHSRPKSDGQKLLAAIVERHDRA